MSQDVAKVNETPRGRRLGKSEVAKRLATVEQLLLESRPRGEIVEECKKKYPGIAPRTVDDYIARANEKWVQEAKAAQPSERGERIAHLRALIRRLEEKGAWTALVNAQRLLIDVLGLRAPSRLELCADVNAHLAPEPLSPDRMKTMKEDVLRMTLHDIRAGEMEAPEWLPAALRDLFLTLDARAKGLPVPPDPDLMDVRPCEYVS